MVPGQNGYHGMSFPATRGTTQGNIVSPTIFNVFVENIIWAWLSMTLEDYRMAHGGLGEAVRQCLGGFYVDDDMVGSRDPDWLQHLMNVRKSRSMTCQFGALSSRISAEAKSLKRTGVGYSYRVRL